MKTVETNLSQEMEELLQGQTLVLCHTYSKSLGKVISTALSWVFAIDSKTVRFALDFKSKIVEAINDKSEITLSFVGSESVYSMSGPSKVRVEKTHDITLKMAIIEIEVEDLRDITFYANCFSKILTPL